MRILLVTPTYWSVDGLLGGAERYVDSLSRALAVQEKVTQVRVVTFSRKVNFHEGKGKWFFHCYKSFYMGANPNNVIPNLRAFFHTNFDILYIHQFFTLSTFFFCLYAYILGKKIVMSDHNGGGLNIHKYFNITPLIDLFCATSKLQVQDLRLPFARVATIFGGVDSNFYKVAGEQTRDRDFLFVGRLHKIKGILPLLESVKKANVPCKITLALGPEVDLNLRDVENKIAEVTRECPANINIEIKASSEKLVSLYQTHHWVVLPSIDQYPHENFGLVVLEGMACGALAATSPFCGIKEMAQAFPTPHLMVVKDWTTFIRTYANKPSPFMQGPSAREWVLQHATWQSVAQRFLSHLDKL